MIKAPTYDFTGRKRRVGMRATDAPKSSLHSVFRNPTGGFESQGTNKKMGTSDQSSGLASRNGSLINFEDDKNDELSSTQAPSVTTSSQNTRTRLPAPSHGTKVGDELDSNYYNIEDFVTPKQSSAKSSQRSLSDDDTTPADKRWSGDIKPTEWKSKAQTEEERRKETEMMLREKAEGRMNPQHIRGARFNTEGVKKMVTKQLPGSGWDTGGVKKRTSTYKSKATSGSRNRKSTQTKSSLDTDSEDESKNESKSESLNSSSAKSVGGFRDPTKLYALPEKKVEDDIIASNKGFRAPPPLPPKKDSQTKIDSTENDFPQSKPSGFKNPTEMYKLPKRKTPEPAEPKPKPFIDPFDMKRNNKYEEEESQLRTNNLDDSSDDNMDKGDSRKRKAATAIDLMSKGDQIGKDGGVPSLDDAEFSASGSQSSSQAKKRKAAISNPDICVICNETLPTGTLDAWRYDDGELKPIRMAEWAIICNKHKEARFRKQWNDEGYPVINWGELKNRVEHHHQILIDIITNKVASPFRDVLVSQHKETRGNAAMLLRKDVRLQYPGYYGPRGSSILLHEITARLGSLIGEAAKKDRLIGQGGISAFIQTVLVPEVGVRLIMEDMSVGEPAARKILNESQDLGEKLHFDDHMEDIYDENDGPWFDINATRVVAPVAKKKRGRLVDLCDSYISD